MSDHFEDFTYVTLTHDIETQGIHLPAGSHGQILATWADGRAYEVEFDKPRHVLLTVEGRDLAA